VEHKSSVCERRAHESISGGGWDKVRALCRVVSEQKLQFRAQFIRVTYKKRSAVVGQQETPTGQSYDELFYEAVSHSQGKGTDSLIKEWVGSMITFAN